MKIISKYKDFYDYLTQDHDADLMFVRDVNVHYEYLDDMFRRDGDRIPYYFKAYGYSTYFMSKEKEGMVYVDQYIFGVYPYVYSQPVIRVMYSDDKNMNKYLKFIAPNEIIDGCIQNDKNSIKELESIAQQEIDNLELNHKVVAIVPNEIDKIIKNNTWKHECKDIFFKLSSPVFTKYYRDVFEKTVYENVTKGDSIKNPIHYISGICFNKLNKNITKYWFDELNDLNTYINIENFLWSSKQEPISNPDNNTKIVSHGFDLKTSFRKM